MRPLDRRKVLSLVPASLAALLVARCGGSSGGDGDVVIKPAPPPPGTPTPAVSPVALPPPEIVMSSEEIFQGGTALTSLTGDVLDGRVRFLDRTYPLIQGARSIYAFVGVNTDDPAGDQRLEVDFTMTNGTTGTLQQPLTILENPWTVDEVTLPGDFLSRLIDPVTTEREVGFLSSVYGQVSTEKLWSSDSPWLLPVNGILTTRFGEERSYNGGPITGHHLGTDIGGDEGTPIQATQSGRVVAARQLELRGNMVILDHGGGLFSGYAHMKSFAVGVGQVVTPGQIIGEVGSSGLSTGAHLHWEIAAGGVWVDALRFTDGSNGF
jgi:murein DD-endopeptidase MepM/ murein hydrolase activator NlpD